MASRRRKKEKDRIRRFPLKRRWRREKKKEGKKGEGF
jgi:hypothetical protein